MPYSSCKCKLPSNHFLSNIITILHTNSTNIKTIGPQEDVVAAELEAEEEEEEDKVEDSPREIIHLVFELSTSIAGPMVAVHIQEPTVCTKLLDIKPKLRLKIRWVDPL